MSDVLITGAGGGLGRELSRAFAARGDRLLLVDRDQALLDALQAELPAATTFSHCADLTDEQAVPGMVEAVSRHFGGRLDVLINNAGITHRSPAAMTEPAVFRRVMQVDWQAPVELSLALLPLLQTAGGSIINIGSMAGWMPVPGRAGYCSAKSALTQFFEVLRAEQAGTGLHILMVYPSFLDTPIEANALGADGGKARHGRSTIGKIGSPVQMADDIVRAFEQRRERLYPNRSIWWASLLWKIAPTLFVRKVGERFANERDAH